jgi:hypothetical protein
MHIRQIEICLPHSISEHLFLIPDRQHIHSSRGSYHLSMKLPEPHLSNTEEKTEHTQY